MPPTCNAAVLDFNNVSGTGLSLTWERVPWFSPWSCSSDTLPSSRPTQGDLLVTFFLTSKFSGTASKLIWSGGKVLACHLVLHEHHASQSLNTASIYWQSNTIDIGLPKQLHVFRMNCKCCKMKCFQSLLVNNLIPNIVLNNVHVSVK
jgi:hypothetical protein